MEGKGKGGVLVIERLIEGREEGGSLREEGRFFGNRMVCDEV